MADLRAQVEAKLAEMRPLLEASGAQVGLVGVEDAIAQVKLTFTPGPGRMVASLQLKSGIERAMRQAIPGLRGVEAVNLPPYVLEGWDR
ncbi:MAG: NifU family protein [Chloroflexi bacterium]|nr:NifU family protein [Chloroflexota bacterium]